MISLFLMALVFQPQFKWADGSVTQQGTGSFVKTPSGKLIGLTSAHFIDFSGPPLLEATWLDISTQRPIAFSTSSWGLPGHEGSYSPLDLRSDYLLLLMEGNPQEILEIDPRAEVPAGERVWFLDKEAGPLQGTLTSCAETHLVVQLDHPTNLHTRSGTPVISQLSNKIIGILTGGEDSTLFLAPATPIYHALSTPQSTCPLIFIKS